MCRRNALLFTNEQNMDCAELKAFADDKLDVAEVTLSVYNRMENIVGKEKTLASSMGVVQSRDRVIKRLNLYHTTNCRLVQIESICRRQFRCYSNKEISLS